MSALELRRGYVQTRVFMDTPVVIEIVAPECDERDLAERTGQAFGWFEEVERTCSRFDEASELRRLSSSSGAVTVSPLLFNALDLALRVARITEGALDPAIGRVMEQSGFNTNYRTGEHVTSTPVPGPPGSYRDILLDRKANTVTLRRPLTLDLGAVAKGLAIDLAAEELSDLPGVAINAGGDVRARGCNADGEPWRIGIRHPLRTQELLTTLRISDAAVCTSGGYERPDATGDGHHIRNPMTGASAHSTLSATAVAPTAVVADALSTAAFVMGPETGLQLLTNQGIDGLIFSSDHRVAISAGMARYDA